MTRVVEPFEHKMRRGGESALREVARFFVQDDPVHRSLRRVTAQLKQLEIPYAVAGAMALVAHGYDRTTVADRLAAFVQPKYLELWRGISSAPESES
jgi:hypothetical protein